MVKIPTFKSESQIGSGQRINLPQSSFGGAQVGNAIANFGNTAMNVADKFLTIQRDKDLVKYKDEWFKGDEDNDGFNAITINRSADNNLQEGLLNYDTQTNDWTTKVSKKITDKAVQRKFDLWASTQTMGTRINVDQSIRKNSKQIYAENIKTDVNQIMNTYLTAFQDNNTLLMTQAKDELFGTDTELGIYGRMFRDDMVPTNVTKELLDRGLQITLLELEAKTLIEQDPGRFIALDNDNYFNFIDANKLSDFKIKAKAAYTSNTIVSLLDYMPLDLERSDADTELLFSEANKGTFGGNESLQAQFKSLDAEGQLQFRNTLGSRRQQIKAEIQWKRNNDIFAEQQANKQNYEAAYQGILSVDENGFQYGISDIESMEWIGAEGVRLKESLIGLVVKREEGNLPTDAGLAMYDAIYDKTIKKEIKSVTEPFLLKGETEAVSILDRIGQDGIGTNQFNILNTNVNNRNNSDIIYAENEFSNFAAAYRDQILGSEAYKKFNSKGDARYLDFTLIMRERYNRGIAAGKTPMDLLLSSSPDYILGDLSEFVPSQKVLMEEIKESMLGTTSTTDLTLQEWLDAAPQKPADMSFEDFKLTQEYLDYQATKPQ
jgi:hypothetical protein